MQIVFRLLLVEGQLNVDAGAFKGARQVRSPLTARAGG